MATRRLARQGGLTPEPEPVTPQPSTPCPEVLSPQVTARRVGPPPTAVSPPSPMQIDKSANSSTSSRIDSSGKTIDTHPYAPGNITSSAEDNVRIRCMQRFMDKGWKHRKIWYCEAYKGYYIMLTRPNRDHCVILFRPKASMATVFKGPDSKYHVPDFHRDHTNLLNEQSHNACKRSLPVSREVIIRDLAKFATALPRLSKRLLTVQTSQPIGVQNSGDLGILSNDQPTLPSSFTNLSD